MKPALSLIQFEELLDQHGAEPANWPEPLAARARELMKEDAAAQSLLKQAQEMEQLLGALPRELPSPQLTARVAQIPAQHPHAPSLWSSLREWLMPSTALAACFAAGLLLSGPLSESTTSDPTAQANGSEMGSDSDSDLELAAQDPEEQWEELLAVAMADSFDEDDWFEDDAPSDPEDLP